MPMQSYTMRAGDSFHHVAAGGGGFGHPMQRDPQAVLADVLEDLVSVEAAKRDYGVVVDPVLGKVDLEETARLRARDVVAAV